MAFKRGTRLLATGLAVPMFVINVLFSLFTALVGCLFCADLVISLLYQFAMPTSAATATASLMLLVSLTPWIIVFIAALADWRRWPANYYKLHALLKRMFRRALRRCCMDRAQRTMEDEAQLQSYNSTRDLDHAAVDAGGRDASGNVPEQLSSNVALQWQDLRELLRYSSCLVIWGISLLISIGSSFTGTWAFVILTFAFVIGNAIFDLKRLRRRPIGKSASVYVLYRKERLSATIFALVIALITLTAVVSRTESSVLGGGPAAVATAYVLSLLTVGALVFLRVKAPRGFLQQEVLELRSIEPKILAAVDALLLLTSSIIMFATTDAEAGGAVLVFLFAISGCNAVLMFSTAKVRLLPSPELPDSDSDDDVRDTGIQLGKSLREDGAEDQELQPSPVAGYGSAGDAASDPPPTPASLDVGRDHGRHDDDGAVVLADPRRPDTRKALRRVAHSTFVFFSIFVAGTSLIDTRSVSYPQVCPGQSPGLAPNTGRFALCDMTFPPSSLSVVDFSALTAVSYMEYPQKVDALRTYFPHRQPFIDDAESMEQKNGAFVGVNFTVVRFPRDNVTVVTVRGSFTSIDWLQDLYIMSDTLAIQVGKAVLPLPLSDSVAASLVAIGGSFKFGMNSYTSRVEAAIDRVRHARPQDTVFITGHSLGGFTANVVAARTETRSVTMSPIGTGFTFKRFDFTKANADEFQLSIIPEGDPVPAIDEQLGLQQFFVNPEGCHPKNAFCHALKSTFHVITQNCGDPLGRRVAKSPDQSC